MVQKLSNKIVDIEKDKGSSSCRNPFNPYDKKKEESVQSQPPVHNSSILNFNEVGMDNFCTFHQEHHSKKTKLSTMDKFNDSGYESIVRCPAGGSQRRRSPN